MTDNQVWQILIGYMAAEMTARGLPATVQQAYQPTQQGTPAGPTVAISTIDSKRYGFPEDSSKYDPDLNEITRRTGYWLEKSYQVNALAIQDPKTPDDPTAFDYIDAAADILQTTEARDFFRQYGIGILRVQPLRVQYFVDDRDRHEQVPSFDFTLTYRQTKTATAEPIQTAEAGIYRV